MHSNNFFKIKYLKKNYNFIFTAIFNERIVKPNRYHFEHEIYDRSLFSELYFAYNYEV